MTLLDGLRLDLSTRGARRRLGAIDAATMRLTLLARTADALEAADGVVAAGWLQDRWLAWRDEGGREWVAGSAGAHTVPLSAVTRACLVGALVMGAGGTQGALLRSSVETTWHALHGGRGAVDRMRSPAVAASHVRELTAWNDRPGRTPDEVRGLLAGARAVLAQERATSQAELVALSR